MEPKRFVDLLAGAKPTDSETSQVKRLYRYSKIVMFLATLAVDSADVVVDNLGDLDARITHVGVSYILAGNSYGWIVIDAGRNRCILESSEAVSIGRRFRTYLKRIDSNRI